MSLPLATLEGYTMSNRPKIRRQSPSAFRHRHAVSSAFALYGVEDDPEVLAGWLTDAKKKVSRTVRAVASPVLDVARSVAPIVGTVAGSALAAYSSGSPSGASGLTDQLSSIIPQNVQQGVQQVASYLPQAQTPQTVYVQAPSKIPTWVIPAGIAVVVLGGVFFMTRRSR